MKIVHIERLIDAGRFSQSKEWRQIKTEVAAAIEAVQWPPGSGSFTLYDEPGKERGKGSGVKPIKEACMLTLKSFGWRLETPLNIAARARPGPLDATCQVHNRLFCLE